MANYGIGFYTPSGSLITHFDFGELNTDGGTDQIAIFELVYKKGENDGSVIKNVLLKVTDENGEEKGPFVEDGLVTVGVKQEGGVYDYVTLMKNKYCIIPEMKADTPVTVKVSLQIPFSFTESYVQKKFKILAIPGRTSFPITSLEDSMYSEGLLFSIFSPIAHKNFAPIWGNPLTIKKKDFFIKKGWYGQGIIIKENFQDSLYLISTNDNEINAGYFLQKNVTGIPDSHSSSYPNAYDNNTGTYATIPPHGWIQVELQFPIKIHKYTVESRYMTNAARPKHWILKGSNDGVNWDTLHTVNNYMSSPDYTANISPAKAYKFYRLDDLVQRYSGSSSVVYVRENKLFFTSPNGEYKRVYKDVKGFSFSPYSVFIMDVDKLKGDNGNWRFGFIDGNGKKAYIDFYPSQMHLRFSFDSMTKESGFSISTIEKMYIEYIDTNAGVKDLLVKRFAYFDQFNIHLRRVRIAKNKRVYDIEPDNPYIVTPPSYINNWNEYFILDWEQEKILKITDTSNHLVLGPSQLIIGKISYEKAFNVYRITPDSWYAPIYATGRILQGLADFEQVKEFSIATWMYKDKGKIVFNADMRHFSPLVANNTYTIWIGLNGEVYIDEGEIERTGMIKYAIIKTDENANIKDIKYFSKKSITPDSLLGTVFRLGISSLGGNGKVRKEDEYMRIGDPIGRGKIIKYQGGI